MVIQLKSSNDTTPLVSVIMPAYNHGNYVREAILSVVEQTYKNIELIIIDDGSTDETRNKIERTLTEIDRDLKIKFLAQKNAGLCETLNRGLALAKGEFVQFLASDDAYLPEKTRRGVEVLMATENSVAAVYCDGYIVDEKSRRRQIAINRFRPPFSLSVHRELIVGNWLPALSILYRRSVLDELGGFDTSLKLEDWDLLLRLTEKYTVIRIPDRLFYYRDHRTNMTKDSALMKTGIEQVQAKHKKVGDFIQFRRAIRRLDWIELFGVLSWSNIDLLARLLLRRLQISKEIHGDSLREAFVLLAALAFKRMGNKLRASIYRLCGYPLGKGCLVTGKIKIRGNRTNLKVGENVVFDGTVTIVLPRARGLGTVEIGDNSAIQNNALLQCFAGQIVIGNNCSIGKDVVVQSNGNISIGAHTMIAAQSGIYATNHVTCSKDIPYNQQGYHFIGIEIGANCWLGHGVVVVDGSKIGANSIIGPNMVIRGEHKPSSRLIN